MQDTYSTSDPALGSRVAYGLAGLPRFPQLCNLVQHQYSDLFLLRELLEVFPSHQPLHIEQVLQLLERRGVNTQTCYPRIAAILNSQSLPRATPTR
ncbi:MAG: hypothetical protein HC925_06760 [Coleofasciculaceae cyanobacterium SM2_3_26]|nr:hypothetical protein [Coleofasciculaceae cyanobacterium SM2_3_26]